MGHHWMHHYHHHHPHHYHYHHGPYHARLHAVRARDDEEIKRDVQDALFWDTWVDASQVQVEVKNGVVTLRGTVDSALEKRAAEADAWDVPGVVDVHNLLEIRR